jgi:hypothetical protein
LIHTDRINALGLDDVQEIMTIDIVEERKYEMNFFLVANPS